ncbi:MAG: type I DNA topoisomerase [Ruminococcaceae bacterium]|nr:type I DNA topoisomerase [Oscillospiraceae bacterium]
MATRTKEAKKGKLVIVESPAKAGTIKKYLGKDYKIMASMGHLIDLPKSQLGIDTENNFEPKYITIRGKAELVNSLKKEAKLSEKVYLATDPDREGEAISWHLAHVLDIGENEKCRITFNEITKTAVTSAIKTPRKINIDLVDAQQARRILDRIVGYKISPILWKKVKKGLSAGRVQSVATRLICDRENEINDFIEEEYWTIDLHLIKDKKSFVAKFYGKGDKKQDLKTKADTDKILSALEGASFTVTDVKESVKQKSPAPPFTTSTLQQEAARKLGFTTKRTMQAAQQLYEGVNISGKGLVGLITYMRTDSLRISTEFQFVARNYIEKTFGKEYITSSPRIYKTKKDAQDAHEAIRPTSLDLSPAKIKDNLSADQFKLYKLVWERFLSSQMSNVVYDSVSATIEANSYTFKANGSTVKFDGFTTLYTEGVDQKEETEKKLPPLSVGDVPKFKDLKAEQKFTQPPSRYTEASLIKALEEKGIGRPSTYSPTITTIIARGYVLREKKMLKPTELGMIITDIMKEHFPEIVDVTFTAAMEDQLDIIADGDIDWHTVIDDFYKPFEKTVKNAEDAIGNVELKDEVSDVVCDKCGRLMVYKHGRFGKFLACPGFPECRNAKPIIKKLDVLCPKCGNAVIEKKTKTGKVFYGCENYPECDFTSWDKPLEEKCPDCGGMMFQRTGRFKGKYCVDCQAKKELEKKTKKESKKTTKK